MTDVSPDAPPGMAEFGMRAGRLELADWPWGSVISLSTDKAADVAGALATGDPAKLDQFRSARAVSFAPFFCPRCRAVYCAKHWNFKPVFDEAGYDCTEGTCSLGHFRMLDD